MIGTLHEYVSLAYWARKRAQLAQIDGNLAANEHSTSDVALILPCDEHAGPTVDSLGASESEKAA
jgi:hypothetical protein